MTSVSVLLVITWLEWTARGSSSRGDGTIQICRGCWDLASLMMLPVRAVSAAGPYSPTDALTTVAGRGSSQSSCCLTTEGGRKRARRAGPAGSRNPVLPRTTPNRRFMTTARAPSAEPQDGAAPAGAAVRRHAGVAERAARPPARPTSGVASVVVNDRGPQSLRQSAGREGSHESLARARRGLGAALRP